METSDIYDESRWIWMWAAKREYGGSNLGGHENMYDRFLFEMETLSMLTLDTSLVILIVSGTQAHNMFTIQI